MFIALQPWLFSSQLCVACQKQRAVTKCLCRSCQAQLAAFLSRKRARKTSPTLARSHGAVESTRLSQ